MTTNSYQQTLFGCFSDLRICFYGSFFPPCLSAMTWARINRERCTCCHCLCHNHPFWVRQFIKDKYNIEKNYLNDCLIFTFCYPCAVCQDAREMQARDNLI